MKSDDTIHSLRHDQSHASNDRKIEIQEEIDNILYAERPSFSDYIEGIKSQAESTLVQLEDAGFSVGVQTENPTETALFTAYHLIMGIIQTIDKNERFARLLKEADYKIMSRILLRRTDRHLTEACKNFDACEPSCAPGFDCGYVEVQLAMENVKKLLEHTKGGQSA